MNILLTKKEKGMFFINSAKCKYLKSGINFDVSWSTKKTKMRKPYLINNPDKIDRELIASEIKNDCDVTIQFSEPKYSDKMLSEINELCFEYDDRLRIRFYGFLLKRI